MSRRFEIEWPDFGVSVAAELDNKRNHELCDEFWEALPFQSIFAASMSAGEIFKVPVPVSFAYHARSKATYVPDEPVGSILSGGLVGSLRIKYGTATEPLLLPRIALISSRQLPKFLGVAAKLRDAYFFTKVVNLAIFRTIKNK